jgi:hypothetical protein
MPPIISNVFPFFVFSFEIISTCNQARRRQPGPARVNSTSFWEARHSHGRCADIHSPKHPGSAGRPEPGQLSAALEQYGARKSAHVGIGTDLDVIPSPEGVNDVSDFPKLTRGLLERGYKEEDIRKILGGNSLRVLRQATGR